MRTNTAEKRSAANPLPRTAGGNAALWCIAKAARTGEPFEAIKRKYRPHLEVKANEVGGHATSGPGGELESSGTMARWSAAAVLRTALGQMKEAIRVPLAETIHGLLAEPAAYSHVEGRALKVSSTTFQALTLQRILRAVVFVTTDELLELVNADRIIGAPAQRALVKEENAALFDPTRAGSLSYGLGQAAGGNDYADADYDLQELFAACSEANPETLYFIAEPSVIRGLAGLRTQLGDFAYPGLSVRDGGVLLGVPVIPAPGLATGTIVLADGAEVIYGYDDVTFTPARHAQVEMSSEPVGDVVTPGTMTDTVSLFQSGAVALRVAQNINANMRRPGCIAALTDFNPSAAITT